VISGKRVRLRAIEREDIPTFVKWVNDPELQGYLGRTPYPISFAAEERWFERQLNDEKSRIFAIETEKGVHIGNIGLHEIAYKDGKATLGIMIGEKGYWDQGYGTDAIRTLLSFAFQELNLHRVSLEVFEFNSHWDPVRKAGFTLLREVWPPPRGGGQRGLLSWWKAPRQDIDGHPTPGVRRR